MTRLWFVFVVLLGMACKGPEEPIPVQRERIMKIYASPVANATSAQEDATREAAHREFEERTRKETEALVRADLALLESTAPEKKMADAIRGSEPEICHLINRADAGSRLFHSIGSPDAMGALQVDSTKVHALYLSVSIEAAKKLYDVLKTSPQGVCSKGTEGELRLDDTILVFTYLRSIYDEAGLIKKDVGFDTNDVRGVALAKGLAVVAKHRVNLLKPRGVESDDAYFAIASFIDTGFTPNDLGLSPAEEAVFTR